MSGGPDHPLPLYDLPQDPWGRVFYGHAGAPGGFSLAARRRAVVELRIVARQASAVLHQMRLAYRRRSAEPAKRAAAAGVSRHADHRPTEAAHVAVRGCELVRPGRRPGRISRGPVLTGGEQCHAKSTCLPFTRAALRHVPSNLKPNRRAAFNERVFSVLQRHTKLRLPSEFLNFPPPEPALTDATSAAHAVRPHKV